MNSLSQKTVSFSTVNASTVRRPDNPWGVSAGDCRIKVNNSREGTGIYHIPGDRSYGRTPIDTPKGER